MKKNRLDKIFLSLTISILIIGILMFISASLGILAKDQSKFYNVLTSQIVFGLGAGIIALVVALKIPYTFWRKYAFYGFLGSLVLVLLVFVPHLGYEHGGARRWIELGPVSFQPVEFLKLSFIMYFAAWLSWVKNKLHDGNKYSVIPLAIGIITMLVALLRQPDTKSLILMMIAALSMLIVSGVKWRWIGMMAAIAIGAFLILLLFKPYLVDRVKTFLNPANDPRGSSYQIQQSLIAIGSGGFFGRGYGQSIQKFSYLPEPQGDSIFAVIGEEFGFIGTTTIVILFLAFALRGLRIANRAPDSFSRLLATGIVILLVSQSFLNIAALIGLFPLTGVPLVFISHGGTSLAFSLAAVGILLNISRFQKAPSTLRGSQEK